MNAWLVIVGWIIIVIGWFITNNQSNKRESRKELRASLDNIIEDIHESQNKALVYYTTPFEDSHKLSFEIKASQSRLIKKIERLRTLHPSYFKLEPVSEYMHALTGDDFESNKRVVRTYDDTKDNLLLNITFQTNALIDQLESDYCHINDK